MAQSSKQKNQQIPVENSARITQFLKAIEEKDSQFKNLVMSQS